MPVLRRFGSVSIRLYADDHRPPHFHVVGPDFQVLVAIATGQILQGKARAKDIAEALAWAKEHRDELEALWMKLNERT